MKAKIIGNRSSHNFPIGTIIEVNHFDNDHYQTIIEVDHYIDDCPIPINSSKWKVFIHKDDIEILKTGEV